MRTREGTSAYVAGSTEARSVAEDRGNAVQRGVAYAARVV